MNLCSAGTESEEMVVNMSHGSLVGQHLQLVSNFSDASMLQRLNAT